MVEVVGDCGSSGCLGGGGGDGKDAGADGINDDSGGGGGDNRGGVNIMAVATIVQRWRWCQWWW